MNTTQEKFVSTNQKYRPEGKKGMPFLIMTLPVIAFYNAIRNFHYKPWRKYIIIFGVIYGFTYIPILDSDGDRYGKRFEQQGIYPFSKYFHDIKHIYEPETQYPDIYAFSLFYFIGKLSSNKQFFYAVTALLYFIVFISLVGAIYDESKKMNGKPLIWFILGVIFLLNFSSGMNGVRWPMALMVFLYSSVKLIYTKKLKYLLLAASSVFIHFAILYSFLFLVVYISTFKFYKPIYGYVFLVFAVFSSAFFSEIIQANIGFFGESYEDRVMDYTTNEIYKSNREDHVTNWHWYVQLNFFARNYFALVVLFLVALLRKKIRFNAVALRLEYISFLMLAVSFLSGKLVDSISNRYITIATGFTFIFLYYLSGINYNNKVLKNIAYLYIPVLILQILITLRADLYTISPLLPIANPILIAFVHVEESIQSLLFGI